MAALTAGVIAGIILAFLGAFFFRFGVFLTVFLSVSGIYVQVVQPKEYLSAGIGLAAALLLAVLAVRFIVALTIFATSVWGGIVAGASVYQLVPVQGRLISILFCATISVVGILVQLLLESRKRKRRNLEKAAEIRETHSLSNESLLFLPPFQGFFVFFFLDSSKSCTRIPTTEIVAQKRILISLPCTGTS